ncbi:alcohol dehydrogenase AdhP [Gloeothece verrucosa]|uniref:Alcohol dehydrogenase n=1 Tax=Gloeothece verrucosa (strain PCC 7822) TaxID=497965 RepID=E0UEH1_GLOV7|nr:alcohol dehydrogenase AdhP [Gloeothece verrucosa]ADN15417.1 Alcohol dehydrogenase GroES domain protein [Gloeothece verrucosa PCC 7822]
MKAAVVHQFGEPLVIEDVPIPEPGYGQVLVKIVASGVCHTDLHAADGDWPFKPNPPFIPGHEGVGYVVKVGEGVTRLSEGMRVGIPWLHSACQACEYCYTGWETLCASQQCTGYTVNGAFAEYALAQAAFVGHIPDELDYIDAAPILCAGVTTYKGLKETEAKPGEWVVISGIGGLGHLAVQYAVAMGLHVVALDTRDDKLELASQLGADLTVNVKKLDPVEIVQKEIGGAHGCLVTAVSVPAFRQAIGTLRRKGTCALVGLPPGEFPAPIFEMVIKRITIRGSIVGTRQDLQECLQFAAQRKVKPTVEIQPLEAINHVFQRLREGNINGRVVLQI